MNRLLVILLLFFLPKFCFSQQIEADSNYIVDYTKQLTTRFYTSQKYSSVLFKNESGSELRYRPNTTMNLGIGASYSMLTLNLAIGFDFLNPDKKSKGETKYLDLQTHVYTRMFLLDLWGQNYRGYYLKQENGSGASYLIRPDLRVYEYGLFGQYVFNGKKYSHRAAFIQDEWQKKSAGSLLLGAQAYYSLLLADSTLNLSKASAGGVRFWNIQAGPTVGYAYTVVLHRNFFATASLSAGVDLGYNGLSGGGEDDRSNLTVNFTMFPRLSFGYNSEKWALNAMFLSDRVGLVHENNAALSINSGNYRLIFTRRFGFHVHTQNKLLKKILPD